MSPPEVWGPAVWTLFHTLVEKLNPNAYKHIGESLFGNIVQICKVLPCPECSNDASNFLAKINFNNFKTKDELKNMLYLFHNWVNAKKLKPLYNYADMNKYKNMNLLYVIKNFIIKYNTKGNMKLLSESFQRQLVLKNFISWFNASVHAFRTTQKPQIVHQPNVNNEKNTNKINANNNQISNDKNNEKNTNKVNANNQISNDKNNEKNTNKINTNNNKITNETINETINETNNETNNETINEINNETINEINDGTINEINDDNQKEFEQIYDINDNIITEAVIDDNKTTIEIENVNNASSSKNKKKKTKKN
jgi:hypothetical protein